LFLESKSITNQGNSDWSAIGRWSLALLNDADWQGQMDRRRFVVESGETMKADTRVSCALPRKPFTTDKSKKSVLYISGLGQRSLHQRETRVLKPFLLLLFSGIPKEVYFIT
jgi:hypothetical protein